MSQAPVATAPGNITLAFVRYRAAMRTFAAIAIIVAPFLLHGCAAIAVADVAVGTTAFVAKTAVKGTVGAGKLVAKGVGTTTRLVTGHRPDDPPADPLQ